MAEVVLSKTGLVKPDTGQLDWQTRLNDGFQSFENRMGQSRAGDPNGAVEGFFYGQTVYDTQNGVMYECTRPGPAVGTSRALWNRRSPVEAGTIVQFFRGSLPVGYIGFNATYQKALYPVLAAVLPLGLTQTATTFTLPNTTGKGWFVRPTVNNGTSQAEIAQNIGPSYEEFDLQAGTSFNFVLTNVLLGLKY